MQARRPAARVSSPYLSSVPDPPNAVHTQQWPLQAVVCAAGAAVCAGVFASLQQQ